MTADVRDRLRKLTEAREKATPGPWAQHPADGEYVIGEVSADGDSYLDVADTYAFRKQTGYADAAAIVAAHNATPWLVAALTAVLDLADDYQRLHDETWSGQREAISYDFDIIADRIRAVVAAAGDQP